jgi:hypothetical protein
VKLSTYVLLIPALAIAAALAIANQQDVVFSLDPFSSDHPALAFRLPLYLLLFLILGLGILLGGTAHALARLRSRRGRTALPAIRSGLKTPPR